MEIEDGVPEVQDVDSHEPDIGVLVAGTGAKTKTMR